MNRRASGTAAERQTLAGALESAFAKLESSGNSWTVVHVPDISFVLCSTRSGDGERYGIAVELKGDISSRRDHADVVGRVLSELGSVVFTRAVEFATSAMERGVDPTAGLELLAGRIADTIPTTAAWDEAIGPFYTSRQARRLLGDISRQALNERTQRRSILRVRTADGIDLYPAFQFDRGGLVRSLPEVLRLFPERIVDGWTLAGWLRAKHGALGDSTVIDWLRDGREPEPVLDLARRAAARYAA